MFSVRQRERKRRENVAGEKESPFFRDGLREISSFRAIALKIGETGGKSVSRAYFPEKAENLSFACIYGNPGK